MLGDCLAIHFADTEGKLANYCRLKPDRPRKDKNGKPIKYESPLGSNNRAFFPPRTRTALKDVSLPLIITEGEKKAAKADQEGFACLGVTGVWNWIKKRQCDKDGNSQGERELIDDLAVIPWKGRNVFICYDSDLADKPDVSLAEWRLAECLTRHGANVKVVRLPSGEPGPDGKPAKVGLDDFLVSHDPAAFRQLLAEATAPTSPLEGLVVLEADDDPHRLAKLYLSGNCQHADGLTIRFQRERYCKWTETSYCELPDAELHADLTKTVKWEFDRLNILAQKRCADGDGDQPGRGKFLLYDRFYNHRFPELSRHLTGLDGRRGRYRQRPHRRALYREFWQQRHGRLFAGHQFRLRQRFRHRFHIRHAARGSLERERHLQSFGREPAAKNKFGNYFDASYTSVVLPDAAYKVTLVSGSGSTGFLDALLAGSGRGQQRRPRQLHHHVRDELSPRRHTRAGPAGIRAPGPTAALRSRPPRLPMTAMRTITS